MITDQFPLHENLAIERVGYLAGIFSLLRVSVTTSSLPRSFCIVAVMVEYQGTNIVACIALSDQHVLSWADYDCLTWL